MCARVFAYVYSLNCSFTYVYTSIYIYLFVYVSIYLSIYSLIYIHMCLFFQVFTYLFTQSMKLFLYLSNYLCIYVFMCLYIHLMSLYRVNSAERHEDVPLQLFHTNLESSCQKHQEESQPVREMYCRGGLLNLHGPKSCSRRFHK